MSGVAWFGAFLAAVSGVGPGFIFNSYLVLLGLQPQVGSATGMFLTMLTTMAETIQVIILREIMLTYCAYISLMTIVGSCLGLFF